MIDTLRELLTTALEANLSLISVSLTMTVMVGACAFLYYKFKRSGWL